jgi:hypothetical protein
MGGQVQQGKHQFVNLILVVFHDFIQFRQDMRNSYGYLKRSSKLKAAAAKLSGLQFKLIFYTKLATEK